MTQKRKEECRNLNWFCFGIFLYLQAVLCCAVKKRDERCIINANIMLNKRLGPSLWFKEE